MPGKEGRHAGLPRENWKAGAPPQGVRAEEKTRGETSFLKAEVSPGRSYALTINDGNSRRNDDRRAHRRRRRHRRGDRDLHGDVLR